MSITDEPHPLLVFVDLETTGLNPQTDEILEISAIAALTDLAEIGTFHSLVSWSGDYEAVDDFVLEMHRGNGLFSEIEDADPPDVTDVDEQFAAWIDTMVATSGVAIPTSGAPPTVLAGSSITFDRDFIRNFMFNTEDKLHYRMFDVSSLRQAFHWNAHLDLLNNADNNEPNHRARGDIKRSFAAAQSVRQVMTTKLL